MCAWNRGMWAEHIFTVRKELAWFLLDSADTVCVYGGSIECSNVYEIFRKQKKKNILPQLIAPQGAIVQMRSGCTHMPPHSCPHVRITHYRRRCCLLQTHTANKRHWRQMEYDWQSGFTTKSLKSTLYPLYFYFTLNERGREWMYTPLSHANRTRRPCDAPISTQYSSTEEKPTPGKQTHTHTKPDTMKQIEKNYPKTKQSAEKCFIFVRNLSTRRRVDGKPEVPRIDVGGSPCYMYIVYSWNINHNRNGNSNNFWYLCQAIKLLNVYYENNLFNILFCEMEMEMDGGRVTRMALGAQ